MKSGSKLSSQNQGLRGSLSAGKQSKGKIRESASSTKSSSARTSRGSSSNGEQNSRSEADEEEMWQTSYTNEKPSKVYSLDFHGKKLEKLTGIQKYPNCKSVDLSCNLIKKIENLDGNAEICELKLYSNEIKVIEGLGKLRKVQNLQLQHNQISSIGCGLQQLKTLKFLNLGSNRITDIQSQDLKTCINLVFLDLSNNCLKNFKCLNAVPYLEELYLAGNDLEECPDASCCKKLQEIDLANNKLTNLEGIKNLPSLSILNVSGNKIDRLDSLGTSRTIQRLDLSRNKINTFLYISKHFPSLEVLAIEENEITSADQLLHLQQLKDLTELYINGNPFKFVNEKTSGSTLNRQISEILPQLEVLDGHPVGSSHAKPSERHLMRPMTPSQGLSTKTVKDQINVIDHELSFYENMIITRFESMRNLLQSLPSKSESTTKQQSLEQHKIERMEEDSKRPPSAFLLDDERPTSRCGSRARIKEALAFASQNFQHPDGEGTSHL